MTNQKVYDFFREGAWSSSYASHYKCAWLCLYEFENILEALKEKEISLESEAKKVPPEFYSAFIRHETDNLHTDAYRSATSAHIYICMAIEGFINFYGVKRLGETYYKRVLERIGITEKLMLLYLVCFDYKLDPNEGVVKLIRQVFDQRNSLVHPKTKEFTSKNSDKFNYVHPFELEIHLAFEVMEGFISEMCSRDSQINKEFHFKKPNKPIQSSADALAY
ncbi:hypothetical protein C0J08_09895 [Marinomonas sp. CT5]|uniref:hypothetical protein n=1 Tax=Marinomonas sp. CT5 TaxID=2066133 RepID=UPI001BAFAE9A|nr:hypothetical protein [Marinomonas sp. CT5]QUX95704.1 hypothetical protein C0J08_09895 [Marinomonas sp. CT5]